MVGVAGIASLGKLGQLGKISKVRKRPEFHTVLTADQIDLSIWLKQQKLKKDTYSLSSQPYKASENIKHKLFESKVVPAVKNVEEAKKDVIETGVINWNKVLGKSSPLTNEQVKNYTDVELKKIYKLNPENNLKDRAPFAALTHQARGLFQKDPNNFFTNLKNRNKKLISNLDEAKEEYTPGLKELYDTKDRLTSPGSKTREKLVAIARKFNPNASEKKINKSLLDFAHVFGFKQTGGVTRQSKFLDIGGSPDVMYLSPSYANRSIQRSLEGQIIKLITANRVKPSPKLEESIVVLFNFHQCCKLSMSGVLAFILLDNFNISESVSVSE